VFDLRAYDEPLNQTQPLDTICAKYAVVARVQIIGDRARVSVLCGRMTPAMWRDFLDQMKARGVREIHWERHRTGGIQYVKRNL